MSHCFVGHELALSGAPAAFLKSTTLEYSFWNNIFRELKRQLSARVKTTFDVLYVKFDQVNHIIAISNLLVQLSDNAEI